MDLIQDPHLPYNIIDYRLTIWMDGIDGFEDELAVGMKSVGSLSFFEFYVDEF